MTLWPEACSDSTQTQTSNISNDNTSAAASLHQQHTHSLIYGINRNTILIANTLINPLSSHEPYQDTGASLQYKTSHCLHTAAAIQTLIFTHVINTLTIHLIVNSSSSIHTAIMVHDNSPAFHITSQLQQYTQQCNPWNTNMLNKKKQNSATR